MITLAALRNPTTSINLTATIDSALCVGAGGSSGSLADKPIIRNADKKLLIPASQLKGRLRHECEKIARALKWSICESPKAETMCPQRAGLSGNFQRDQYLASGYGDRDKDRQHHCLICQIFGNPVLNSQVLFDDLICTEDPDNLTEVIRPGVTINRRRQTVEENKLYFLETSPANAQLQFQGQIHFLHNCPDFGKALIYASLQHINALGGSKSSGLGWLTWEIESTDIDDSVWQFLAKGGEA
jgi:CRISPR/Cas system CSM-associated protein Csm3 (group 7 of RAMP superfamily)